MKRQEVVTMIVAGGVLAFLFGWLWKKSAAPAPLWGPQNPPTPPRPVITPPAVVDTPLEQPGTAAYWHALDDDAIAKMTEANQERIVYSSIDPVRAKAALDRYVIWRAKHYEYAEKERVAYAREHGVM